MVAMTTTEPWPAAGQVFTVGDRASKPFRGQRPFQVEVVPARLVADLLPG